MGYSDTSRIVYGKLEIEFESPATVVTCDDFLMDFEIVEELAAEATNPLGAISANELSFALSNVDRRFSPANVAGPYYGLIGLGVKVTPYLTADPYATWHDTYIPPSFYIHAKNPGIEYEAWVASCSSVVGANISVSVDTTDKSIEIIFKRFESTCQQVVNALNADAAFSALFTAVVGNLPNEVSGEHSGPFHLDWDQMGEFYVTSWNARLTDAVAMVTCQDEVQSMLQAPMPNIDIKQDYNYYNLLTYIFNTCYDMHPVLDSDLSNISVPYGIVTSESTARLLSDLISGAMGFLTTLHTGTPFVGVFKAGTPVATWTDDDQILAVSVPQDIVKKYSDVSLTYALPRPSDEQEVLKVTGLVIPAGTNTLNFLKYSSPVWDISSIRLEEDTGAAVLSYSATNLGITLTTNAAGSTTGDLYIIGRFIAMPEQQLPASANDAFYFANQYVQTPARAAQYKAALLAFLTSSMPTLSLRIRGDARVVLGDTVAVSSDSALVTYTGIVQRLVYTYNGALVCDATLMNAEAF